MDIIHESIEKMSETPEEPKASFRDACAVLESPLTMALEMGAITGLKPMIEDLQRGLQLIRDALEAEKIR